MLFRLTSKLSLAAIILLIPAIIVMISHWHWVPETEITGRYLLYLTTETVTKPWGIITTVLFVIWLFWRRTERGSQYMVLLVVIIAVVGGGQILKGLLKQHFQEPRPYVVALMDTTQQSGQDFYQQTKANRKQLIQQRTANWPIIPHWQRTHWQHETGYSFPSGHSMFVSCWVLLFYGLLSVKQRWGTIILVTLWGWSVMWSRMALGMHWPQDVVASVVIAWALTTCCVSCYYIYLARSQRKEKARFFNQ